MKLKVPDCLTGKHNDELNIACAELEGWTNCKLVGEKGKEVIYGVPPKTHDEMFEIANYVSLDAIEALGNVHRLEGLLDKNQLKIYIIRLGEVCGVRAELIVRATAAQRVVALLLVLKPEMFE